MPVPLEPGDRKFLIVAGGLVLVILVVALAFSPPPAQPRQGFPSTHSAAPDGAKAAFLLLKDLGYPVERWERSPTELPSEPASALLILAEPLFPSSAEERYALRAFLRAGGRGRAGRWRTSTISRSTPQVGIPSWSAITMARGR